ncbi:hypothetical protein NLJ89_g6885 [Agrocybe chaxingu]|uniref:Protein kinase domain-containing protein n=1 Tax=Agrocybe chaxingu TaxID=84603 RepID=A0A9W8JVK3_9AGAR|nr:hypothetical protein NLJ89_g6885 [Agrocybe chaxingu]
MDINLTIPFQFPLIGHNPWDSDFLQERHDFWDSPTTFRWFEARGYTLYRRVCLGDHDIMNPFTVPRLPTEDSVDAEYPYPYHDSYIYYANQAYTYSALDKSGKVVFAQDVHGRHVAIKLVPNNTDELRILQLLNQQSLKALEENCLIPVLEFLPIKGFCFVVMPRWGASPAVPTPGTLREVVQIMRSMLKDISMQNLLVNHFASEYNGHDNPGRTKLRSAGLLSYALFDFDISVIVPPTVSKSDFRLPYRMSWDGSYNQPFDTAQGEFDYDPFAFDVGTMGREFCRYYQHASKDLPLLAPLLDGMTTRNIPRRFTASEALEFLEARLSEVPDKHLQQPFLAASQSGMYDRYDRWQHVPPDFAQKWAMYREPRLPVMTRFLRWLCSFEAMLHVIPFIRRTMSSIWAIPYQFITSAGLRGRVML